MKIVASTLIGIGGFITLTGLLLYGFVGNWLAEGGNCYPFSQDLRCKSENVVQGLSALSYVWLAAGIGFTLVIVGCVILLGSKRKQSKISKN